MSSTVTASARQYTAANSEWHSISSGSYTGLNPGNTNFYMAGWVYANSLSTNIIYSKWQSAGGSNSFEVYYASSNLTFIGTADGANVAFSVSAGAMSTSTWYFIEIYHDATNDLVGISINRAADTTSSYSSGLYATSSVDFGIGAGAVAFAPWDGRIGPTMFIATSIPTTAERDALYNSGNGVLYKDRPTLGTATYVSWWDGAETSGVRIDATGTNNLTDNNTVTSAAGKVTYTAEDASQFTAANSEYLSINSNSTLQTGDIDFSFAGWAYMDSLATFRILLPTKWSGVSGSLEYALEYDTSPSVGFAWYVSSNGTLTASVVATAPVIAVNNWYFIVCWHDSVNNVIRISVNDGTVYSTAHSTGVYVGTTAFTPGKISTLYMSGRMTNWSFWKKVLSASEITQLYNRGFGLDYTDYDAGLLTSLISSWPLTEASGTRVDVHGTNDLTDNNSVTGNPGVVYDAQAVVTFRPTMMLLGVG